MTLSPFGDSCDRCLSTVDWAAMWHCNLDTRFPIKTFDLFSNFSRVKEIVTVLARNGYADVLHRLDLPPRILSAFGNGSSEKLNQWGRIRSVLERLGPTFIKFGQLLSMRPDVAQERLIIELRKLQERVPPTYFEFILPEIENSLRASIYEVFESIEETAAAGASMAQVHFAVLKESGDHGRYARAL